MTLLNFEDDLDEVVQKERPYLAATRSKTHLITPPATGDWHHLRDYIMGRIEDLHGPQVRDGLRESIIIKAYMKRWGDRAEPIARHLLEDLGGYWNGSAILLINFCKGADPYVARPIAERLGR